MRTERQIKDEILFQERGRNQAFNALNLYRQDLITIGKLSEILGQSPPVVRRVVVEAARKMSNKP
jgi:hypothetical protein